MKNDNTHFFLLPRALLTIAPSMRDSSSDSLSASDNWVEGNICEASRRRSQKSVSRAFCNEMFIRQTKSLLLCAAVASSTFAPIEVPDRSSCLPIVLAEIAFGNFSTSAIIYNANRNVLALISSG